jgi:hypothetical protein
LRRSALALACLGALGALGAGPAQAVDAVWAGGTGDWSDAAAWSTLAVPDAASVNVYLDGGKAVASLVTLSGSATIGTLGIDALDALTVGGGGSLTVAGGTITNNGTLTVAGGNNGFSYLRLGGDTTLAGTGTTVLGTDNSGYYGQLFGNGHTLTISSGHTLRGNGHLGGGDLGVVNQGTVIADGPQALTIDLGSARSFDNAAGLVQLNNGAALTLVSGTLSGGSISSLGTASLAGSGTLQNVVLAGTLNLTGNNTLTGVTITGNTRVAGGASTYASGTITNNGTFTVAGGNNGYSYLRLLADTTLAGSGTTVLGIDNTGYYGQVLGNGHTLTIASGHTLRGNGTLGASDLGVVNQGTVFADGPQALTIDLGSSRSFDNATGLVQVADGATLSLLSGTLIGGTVQGLGNSTLSGNGSFQNLVLAGTLVLAGNSSFSGVTISGHARAGGGTSLYTSGTLTNNGTFTVAGGSSGYSYLRLSDDTTLAGSGTTVLGADNSGYDGQVLGNGNTLTIGSGQTLRGAGALGASDINVINQGTVVADGPQALSLDLGNGRSFDNAAGLLQVADGATLNLTSGTLSGGTLQGLGNSKLTGNGLYKDLTLTGTLKVDGGSNVYVAGTLTSTGTFTVAGSNSGYSYLRLNADTTLAGSGTTVLGSDNNGYYGQVLGNGQTLTVASGHTLRGTGTLGGGDLGVVNQGTVIADGPRALTIDLGNANTFNNAAGLVQVADGATLNLASGTLSGGTLRGLGNSMLTGNGVFKDLNLAGTLALAGGGSVYVSGTLSNSGTLAVAGSNSGYAYLRLAADTTLAGSGSTLLSAHPSGYYGQIVGGSHTLTIGRGHTLRGAGIVGAGDIDVVNQGTVIADGPQALTIDLGGAGTFNNTAGLVQVANGGTFSLASGTLSGGTVQGLGTGSTLAGAGLYKDVGLAGTLRVAGGSMAVAGTISNSGRLTVAGSNAGYAYLVLAADTTLAGGGSTLLTSSPSGYYGQVLGGNHTLTIASGHTLAGTGFVGNGDITVVNQGTLAPGEGIGKLSVIGQLDFTDGGRLAIDVGGLTQGTQYDWLAVSGSTVLDGTVALDLSGYSAQVGDSFTFLTYSGTYSGSFDAVTAVGYALSIDYAAHGVTATVTAITPVPEPAGWALMLGGLLGLAGAARRGRQRAVRL